MRKSLFEKLLHEAEFGRYEPEADLELLKQKTKSFKEEFDSDKSPLSPSQKKLAFKKFLSEHEKEQASSFENSISDEIKRLRGKEGFGGFPNPLRYIHRIIDTYGIWSYFHKGSDEFVKVVEACARSKCNPKDKMNYLFASMMGIASNGNGVSKFPDLEAQLFRKAIFAAEDGGRLAVISAFCFLSDFDHYYCGGRKKLYAMILEKNSPEIFEEVFNLSVRRVETVQQ